MSTVLINQLPLFYTTSQQFDPDDEVVLFLHGRGQTHKSFKSLMKQLDAQGKSRVAIDFPGFGASPRPKEVRGMAEYAHCVSHFLAKKKILTVQIVGHSFGCRVALWMSAHTDPRDVRITSQLLFGPGGVEKMLPRWKRFIYATAKNLFALPGLRALGDKLKQRFGSADYHNAGAMKDIFVRVVNQDLSSLLPQVSVPTKIVWGDQDDQIARWQVERMKKYIPDAELEVIQGAGHRVHEGYGLYTKLLRDDVAIER